MRMPGRSSSEDRLEGFVSVCFSGGMKERYFWHNTGTEKHKTTAGA